MSPNACPCPHCRWHRIINAELSQANEQLRYRLGVALAQLAALDPDAVTIDEIWGDVSPTPAQAERLLRDALATRDLATPADDPDATARRLVQEALGEGQA